MNGRVDEWRLRKEALGILLAAFGRLDGGARTAYLTALESMDDDGFLDASDPLAWPAEVLAALRGEGLVRAYDGTGRVQVAHHFLAEDPPHERGRSSVYIVEAGPSGPCKVGYSERVRLRIEDLQVGNPQPLRLLGTLPGGIEVESALHAHLRSEWLHGEWFLRGPRLRALIGEVSR